MTVMTHVKVYNFASSAITEWEFLKYKSSEMDFKKIVEKRSLARFLQCPVQITNFDYFFDENVWLRQGFI